jgi:uncharacterized protein YdaU (DUF1376 family)
VSYFISRKRLATQPLNAFLPPSLLSIVRQVYKQVFPFYSRDQYEREVLRLSRQLEAVQQRVAAHADHDAKAKSTADARMRQLQDALMQKAQSVRVFLNATTNNQRFISQPTTWMSSHRPSRMCSHHPSRMCSHHPSRMCSHHPSHLLLLASGKNRGVGRAVESGVFVSCRNKLPAFGDHGPSRVLCV